MMVVKIVFFYRKFNLVKRLQKSYLMFAVMMIFNISSYSGPICTDSSNKVFVEKAIDLGRSQDYVF